jgi:hypothetical protein
MEMEKGEDKIDKDLRRTPTWEKLIRLVPGLSGYQGCEKIREADKILRLALADRLASHQAKVEAAKRGLVEGKDFRLLPQLDLLTRKMAQSRDTLAFANYGFSGAFDLQQVGRAELDGMYEFDLALAEQVEALGQMVEALYSEFSQGRAQPEAIRQMEKALGDFMDQLSQR